MKKRLFLLSLLAALLPMSMAAAAWTAETLPMVHLQDARRYVCNPDGVLSGAAVDSLDALLYRLEQTKGVQTVVVAVCQVEGGDCYEFGMQLARKYGVGSKQQNSGLIVVLSTDDRSYYILTGTGLEGTLPDGICKRVENRFMLPAFRQSRWDEGLLQGVRALAAYIEGDPELTAELNEGDDDATGVLLLIFFIAVFVFSIAYNASLRPCPRCGKRAFRTSGETYLYSRGGWDYYRVVSSCRKCHHVETKTVRRPHNDHDDSGLLAGMAIGSLLGGRGGGFGGGGFGGGSFGGGGFGGGGAGGRF